MRVVGPPDEIRAEVNWFYDVALKSLAAVGPTVDASAARLIEREELNRDAIDKAIRPEVGRLLADAHLAAYLGRLHTGLDCLNAHAICCSENREFRITASVVGAAAKKSLNWSSLSGRHQKSVSDPPPVIVLSVSTSRPKAPTMPTRPERKSTVGPAWSRTIHVATSRLDRTNKVT